MSSLQPLSQPRNFSPEFRWALLTLLLRSPRAASTYLNGLSDDIFDFNCDLKVIFTALQEFYATYHRHPSKTELVDTISNAITNAKIDENQARAVASTFETLWSKESLKRYAPDYIRANLDREVRYHQVLQAGSQLPDLMAQDAFDEILPLVHKALSVNISGTLDFSPVHENYQDVLSLKDEFGERISTGLPEFDALIGGGSPKQTLSFVQAATGGGKSTFLCFLAAQAARQGHNVLYVSLELSKQQIYKLLFGAMYGLSRNEPAAAKYVKQKIDADPFDGRISVVDLGTHGTTVAGLSGLIQSFEAAIGDQLDLLVLDHFDDLKFNTGGGKLWDVMSYEAKALRAVAKKHNCTVWTGTQVNREGARKAAPDTVDTASSFDKLHPADLVISLSALPEHSKLHYSKLVINKSRLGPSHASLHLDVNFETTSFGVLTDDQARRRGITKRSSHPRGHKSGFTSIGVQADEEVTDEN